MLNYFTILFFSVKKKKKLYKFIFEMTENLIFGFGENSTDFRSCDNHFFAPVGSSKSGKELLKEGRAKELLKEGRAINAYANTYTVCIKSLWCRVCSIKATKKIKTI